MNKLALFLMLLLATVALAQKKNQQSGTSEKPFASGGRIHFQLSAADYDIQPAKGDRIVVSWTSSRSDATVNIDVKGSEATISTDTPSSNNVHFVIEVPKNSDLQVRLGAGDLGIGAITGNKDIEMGAGDLRLAVPKTDDYKTVDVAVTAGDINGQVFGKSTGGIFRSLKWSGPGRYSLHVHVRAGDVNIVESESI